MKPNITAIAASILIASASTPASAETVGTIKSPDGKLTLTIDTENGTVGYTLSKDAQILIERSAVGIATSEGDFTSGVTIDGMETAKINNTFTLPAASCNRIDDICNQATITLVNGDDVAKTVFRLYNDGMAFRYEIPGTGNITVSDESSECRIAGQGRIFNSAVDMVKSFSQLGFRSSSVRDIASHSGSASLAGIVAVVRRWGLMLGLLGCVAMLVAAPFLSKSTFGSYDRTLYYMALAIAVFLMAVSASEEAVLQGTGRLRALARASLWGMVGGLAVSVPMFYFLGLESVVPSIIAYVLVTNLALMSRRVKFPGKALRTGLRETWQAGRHFIMLGIYMTATDVIAQVLNYVFIAWLNQTGGENSVGFYQAGFTMVNRYPALIMSAIAMEYYPRLASEASSPLRIRTFVAHEMRLLTLLLTAFVAMFVPLAQLAVRLLYSAEFDVAVPFVTIAMVGVMLRAVSYCMSYVILAKGDGPTFLLTESISAVAALGLNIVAFRLWGVSGLGVSYTLWYLLYVAIIAVVYCLRYRLRVPRRLVFAVCLEVVAIAICVIVAMTAGHLWALVPGVLTAAVSFYCLKKIF